MRICESSRKLKLQKSKSVAGAMSKSEITVAGCCQTDPSAKRAARYNGLDEGEQALICRTVKDNMYLFHPNTKERHDWLPKANMRIC